MSEPFLAITAVGVAANLAVEQCDQMIRIKVAKIFPKMAKKQRKQFYLKNDKFQSCPIRQEIFQLALSKKWSDKIF